MATPNDFGAQGARPTHPELLDWLAAQFIREGWSIKAMHRLIMNSAVYQQSAVAALVRARADPIGDQTLRGNEDVIASRDQSAHALTSVATATDPENQLLSHFNIQRLEAEEIRDALFAVAGGSTETGGKTLALKIASICSTTSKDPTIYDSLRRSIYLPIIRNHLYEFNSLTPSRQAHREPQRDD